MKNLLLAAAAILPLMSAGVSAQEIARTSGPVQCLQAGRVDHTKILDDKTILFHMKAGKQVYRNTLTHKCSGLKFNDGFAYSASGNSICKGQQIKVINTMGGSVCSLGEFMPETH